MNAEVKAGSRSLPYSQSRSHSQSHVPSHSLAAAADLKLLGPPPGKATKGKHKEENWQFGWWDYAPLLEGRRPPVQWTSSSLIITAHPTEPRVVCLHFPSNKHFTLPSPPYLAASSAPYEPPTVITASVRDRWIFAYFPGIDLDGVGCLWTRTRLVDDWVVKECRTYARGGGVVTARWLSSEREWVSTDSGTSARLPTLGPFIPMLDHVLFVVTETHLCNVYYIHPQTEQVKMLSVSLSRRSTSREGQEWLHGERVDGPRGLGKCTHAAIGFGYDESSILVATYSSFVPSTTLESFSSSTADMSIPPGMTSHVSEPAVTSDWETWRDDNIVEICEVNISVHGFLLSLATTPLPSIRNFPPPNRYLTGLTFAPALPSLLHGPAFPSTPTQTHRIVTPQSSPAIAHAHMTPSPGRTVHRSPVKGTPPKHSLEKIKGKPIGALYLVCTTLDLGQHMSTLKSDVSLYVFYRNPVDLAVQTWYYKRTSQLTVPSGIVMHLSSSQPTNSPQHAGALIGILNTEGQNLKRKEGQQLSVGRLQMLRLPDLQFDDNWESTNIVCPVGSCGVELPFSIAVSPNRILVCAVSSLSTITPNASTSIYSHPIKMLSAAQDFGAQKKRLALSLEINLRKRVMPGDVIHVLAMKDTPIPIIEEVLAAVLLEFDANGNGLAGMWTNEVVGTAVEVYRTRSLLETEKDDLTSRYEVGHEICSISACNAVWEDTLDSKGYDLEDVWYLTSLCAYFIEFLEKLMKECVEFVGDEHIKESSKAGPGEDTQPLASPKLSGKNGDLFSSSSDRPTAKELPAIDLSCSLTHIIHPYALDNFHSFLRHVRRFRAYLGANARQNEHYQMAKEILIDTVDSSGIELDALDKAISEIWDEVKANAERVPDLARRCLASLKPPTQYATLLQKIVAKIIQAQVVDKSRLFIKPDDFADGMFGLSVSARGEMPDRDVISKGFLSGLRPSMSCLRCGGKSEISAQVNNAPGRTSVRWVVWGQFWQSHCVCGGQWSSKP